MATCSFSIAWESKVFELVSWDVRRPDVLQTVGGDPLTSLHVVSLKSTHNEYQKHLMSEIQIIWKAMGTDKTGGREALLPQHCTKPMGDYPLAFRLGLWAPTRDGMARPDQARPSQAKPG